MIGESMTPVLAQRYVNAFGAYLEGAPVALARDPRASSTMLHAATLSALLSCGCEVHDLGVCPTPVAQFYTRAHDNIMGGLAITGGHNNADWNGIVPFRRDGTLFDTYDGHELLEVFHAMTFRRMAWQELGAHMPVNGHIEFYLDALLSFLDSEAIRSRNLTVVVDPCNGAAARLSVLLPERLNCNVIPINNEPNGIFPHDPEPRPRNGKQVSSIIKAVGADIGFCFSSDGTRLSVVSNTGETVTEEYTYPLVADYCLSRKNGSAIVTNICTTRTLDDVAARYSSRVVKTRIGQSAVIPAMLNERACLAGEGSGGVAVAAFQPAFDAFVAMGLLLESMAKREKTCDELISLLPRYHLEKQYVWCRPDSQYAAVEAVRKTFLDESRVDTTDGVRIDWDDGWLHVRAAATEPIVRVVGESSTAERATERVDYALHIIYSTI